VALNNHNAEVSVGQTDATASARPLTVDQWLDNVANSTNVGPPKRDLVQINDNDPILPLSLQRKKVIDDAIDRDISGPKAFGGLLGAGAIGARNLFETTTRRPVTNYRTSLGALGIAEGGSWAMDKLFFHDDTPGWTQADDALLTPAIVFGARTGRGMLARAGIALAVHLAFKLFDHAIQPKYVLDPEKEALSNLPTNKINNFQNPADVLTGKKDPPPLTAPLPRGVFPYAQFGPQERAIQDDNRLRQFYHMPLGPVPKAGDNPFQLPPGMIPGSDKSVTPPTNLHRLPQTGDDAGSILNQYGIQLK